MNELKQSHGMLGNIRIRFSHDCEKKMPMIEVQFIDLPAKVNTAITSAAARCETRELYVNGEGKKT